MKASSKIQRPPFQAVPELLLPRLVDEQLSMYDLLERDLWVRTLWLCQPTEGNTRGTHSVRFSLYLPYLSRYICGESIVLLYK